VKRGPADGTPDDGEARFERAAVEVGGHGAIPATLPETVLALRVRAPTTARESFHCAHGRTTQRDAAPLPCSPERFDQEFEEMISICASNLLSELESSRSCRSSPSRRR